jgi:hypothetical protein
MAPINDPGEKNVVKMTEEKKIGPFHAFAARVFNRTPGTNFIRYSEARTN